MCIRNSVGVIHVDPGTPHILNIRFKRPVFMNNKTTSLHNADFCGGAAVPAVHVKSSQAEVHREHV